MSDLISRQEAIDAIEHRLAEPAYQHTGEDWYVGMNCAESEIYELPSAEPERKKGQWIHDNPNTFKCSKCNKYLDICCGNMKMNFCPNCEADMRGEQE